MKFNIILATICLALGATIAWVAKPSSDPATAQSEDKEGTPSSEQPAAPPSDTKREVSERKIVESEATIVPETPEGGDGRSNRMQNRMGEMFKKRQMAKLDARISKLVSQLNLTPAQEAALRKAGEEKMSGFGDLFGGNGDPSRIGDMLKGDDLDEALADILTPEQKEELEAVEKRELANKVEAKALKDPAKLSGLDLSQEQKDQAYDILYKQAEGTVTTTAASGATGMLSMITEGMGIELDADALGIAATMIPSADDIANGEIEQPNPQEMMAKAKENMDQKIDDKVEALRPVLNETQLEQDRKDLELKSGGLFGGFLGGFGGAGGE